jgi:hypothetical protein
MRKPKLFYQVPGGLICLAFSVLFFGACGKMEPESAAAEDP